MHIIYRRVGSCQVGSANIERTNKFLMLDKIPAASKKRGNIEILVILYRGNMQDSSAGVLYIGINLVLNILVLQKEPSKASVEELFKLFYLSKHYLARRTPEKVNLWTECPAITCNSNPCSKLLVQI